MKTISDLRQKQKTHRKSAQTFDFFLNDSLCYLCKFQQRQDFGHLENINGMRIGMLLSTFTRFPFSNNLNIPRRRDVLKR